MALLSLHILVPLALSSAALLFLSLQLSTMSSSIPISAADPSSYSNVDAFLIKRVHLDWVVDFEAKTVSGSVTLRVEARENAAGDAPLILDTRDLNISAVRLEGSTEELAFRLGPSHPAFGAPLVVDLPRDGNRSSIFNVVVDYSTKPECSALQWLKPQQTAARRKPFLFSQCQAIHARSLVPCQDSPAVKFPYSARVRAPEGMTVLMSAIKEESSTPTESTFVQSVPIPSYLLAIVVGELESREIGPRSRVWAEPPVVDAAAAEFEETEDFIQTAESIVGPYVWGRYDLLVLPPSFPYGGMENPCLTFVTPTLLAGDKSLASVVAHEISHSWTGNLVTNNNPEHFWLNEGHTVFLERKIQGRLFGGEPFRDFCALGGWNDLRYAVETLGVDNPLTMLNPRLEGIDPDDAFSSVPYEKGHTLLYYLESILGGPKVFEPFLRAYVERFKFKSIATEDWKNFLFEHFADRKDATAALEAVDWKAWLHAPGMPPVKPAFDESQLKACADLAGEWIQTDSVEGEVKERLDEGFRQLSSKQTVEFLSQLLLAPEGEVTVEKLKAMENLYAFNSVKNSEIRFRWLRLCLKVGWPEAIPLAIAMATEQGRMKFTRPLFRDLHAWTEARPAAIEAFEKHRPSFHSTTAQLVAKDMNLPN